MSSPGHVAYGPVMGPKPLVSRLGRQLTLVAAYPTKASTLECEQEPKIDNATVKGEARGEKEAAVSSANSGPNNEVAKKVRSEKPAKNGEDECEEEGESFRFSSR